MVSPARYSLVQKSWPPRFLVSSLSRDLVLNARRGLSRLVRNSPMRSPLDEVGDGQIGLAGLAIEPDPGVEQRHLVGEAGEQASQRVRPLMLEPDVGQQPVNEALNGLADAGQVPRPGFRPFAVAAGLWGTDDDGPLLLGSALLSLQAAESHVGHIAGAHRGSGTRQPGLRQDARLEERFGQRSLAGGRRSTSPAGYFAALGRAGALRTTPGGGRSQC